MNTHSYIYIHTYIYIYIYIYTHVCVHVIQGPGQSVGGIERMGVTKCVIHIYIYMYIYIYTYIYIYICICIHTYISGTGTNWGGVLNGIGVAKYRANARVALRALATGAMTREQVGSAGGTYEGDWKDGEWHGNGAFRYFHECVSSVFLRL